ncbi:hypothetical protein Zmor_020030 [Zophobas morio]|uniref:rRNA biogenesis protein RRP36 n=1 Tax=Zophobas morio TaxID=2755281 RepID=A0AA38I385_9CUCU|nr:hypothetical protein Zmor_020030 [Zophobas morio]
MDPVMDESEETNGSNSDSQSDEETLESDRQKVKEQLSEMSFEELQKLKEEMGTKLYSQTVFGKTKTKVKTFKRVNKNRPREMSSKRIAHVKTSVKVSNKPTTRDPRFESFCGTFDKKIFQDNYKFVNDLRKKERDQLKDELKNTTNEEEKKRIKFAVQRLENQIRNEEMKTSQEDQTYSKNEVTIDKKAPYKKKSVVKLENLVNKYEQLKQTNKIQKHIERKAKKVSLKERKNLARQNLV